MLKLAQDLHDCKTDDYSVSFMGDVDCEPIISNYNNGTGQFSFHSIFSVAYPKGYTAEFANFFNKKRKPWHVWAILYSQYDSVDAVVKAGGEIPSRKLWEDAQSFRNAWKQISPDLLVSGYFVSLEYLLLYWMHKKSNLKFVMLTIFLRLPQNTPFIRAMVDLQLFSKSEVNKIINMATKGVISTDEPRMSLQDFLAPLDSFREMIPCPKECEYDSYDLGPQVRYIDPCIMKEFSSSVPSFNSDGCEINWDEFLAKKNIIFATVGSQVQDYEDKAELLFHSMCKAMDAPQFKDCFLIVAAGSKLTKKKEWRGYDKSRILIASWVPQRRLLSDGDVKCAIIHGGLSSIKECVYFNCPFVVAPLGKDQVENALRLRYLGINNMILGADVNPKGLVEMIDKVTSDSRTKENLKKLSDVFVAAESKKEGLHIIQEVLKA